jgi:preprotein translocase subunit SecG
MSSQFFSISQLILGIALIILVLIQVKGTGLGSTFGSTISFYQTRRGIEKMLFYLTCIIAGLFLLVSVLRLLW